MSDCCDANCGQGRLCPHRRVSSICGWLAVALTTFWALFLYSLAVTYG